MNYPGGKGGCFRTLLNQIPPHQVYIEPFLGGGNLLERKKPAPVASIGVDLDAQLIEQWKARAPQFDFYCMDGIRFLQSYTFTGAEFVYCDPPYLLALRKKKRIYRHEMTTAQHEALLAVLLRLPCPVMLSGYASSLYNTELVARGWRHIRFKNITRGGAVWEALYCNYPEPAQLHDPRYLGADYRERERIAKMQRRWRARLAKLPRAEQCAMLEILLELLPPETSVGSAAVPALASTDLFGGARGRPGGTAARVGRSRRRRSPNMAVLRG